MRDEDIERAFIDETIIPSAGFSASVMEAVRQDAAVPPPLHFPWARALPGIVVTAAVVTMLAFACVEYFWNSSALNTSIGFPQLKQFAIVALHSEIGLISIALLLSLASAALATRLGHRSG